MNEGVISTTTLGLPNRLRDRAEVAKDLGLIEGASHSDVGIYDHAGVLLCRGVKRLLFGDHGPYLEVERDAVVWSSFKPGPEKLHYDEHHSVGASAQLYDQKKTVASQPNPPRGKRSCHNNRSEGYADYRPGYGYISCWSVQVRAGGETTPLRAMGGGRLRGRIKALDGGAGRIAPSDETGGGDFEGGVAFDGAALGEGTTIAPAVVVVGAEVEYELERRAEATVAVRVVVVALAVEAAAPRARKRAREAGAEGSATAAPKPTKRREGRGVAPRLSLLALFPGSGGAEEPAGSDAGAAAAVAGAAAAAGADAGAARALIVHMFASKALKRIAERLKRWYRSSHCRSKEMSKADALGSRSVAGAPEWLLSVRRGAVVAPMERCSLRDGSPGVLAAALVTFFAAQLAGSEADAPRSVVIVDCNPEARLEALSPAVVAHLRARFPALRAVAVVGANAEVLDAVLDAADGAVPVNAFVYAGSDAARGFAQRSARAAATKRLRATPRVATITYVASVLERADAASNGIDNMVEEIVALCGPELQPDAPTKAAARDATARGAATDGATDGATEAGRDGVSSSSAVHDRAAAPPCFVPVRCALRDASHASEVRCSLFLHCTRADAALVATLATPEARAYCWTCGAIGAASPCDPSARLCAARVAWKSVA